VDFIGKKWDEREKLQDEIQKLQDEYWAMLYANHLKNGPNRETPNEIVELISLLERIVELDPTDNFAWRALAKWWYDLEELENAIKCLDRAIENDENDGWVWMQKGEMLCVLDEEEAIKCFDKLIRLCQIHDKDERLCPDHDFAGCCPFTNEMLSECWFYKGLSLQNLGKYKDALECYDQCIAIDEEYNNDTNLLISKSEALLELGKNDDAIICYDRAVILDRSLKKSMVRPKPKMRLWKRMLSYVAFSGTIIFGFGIVRAIL